MKKLPLLKDLVQDTHELIEAFNLRGKRKFTSMTEEEADLILKFVYGKDAVLFVFEKNKALTIRTGSGEGIIFTDASKKNTPSMMVLHSTNRDTLDVVMMLNTLGFRI